MNFFHLLPTTSLFVLDEREYHPTIPGLTKFDVALGRGGMRNSHAGNVRFRRYIEANYHHYETIREGQKHLFSKACVDRLLESGRFVEIKHGHWEDAPYHMCIRKAQTLLRAYTLERRRRLQPSPLVLSRPMAASPTTVESVVVQSSFDDIEPLPLLIQNGDSSKRSSREDNLSSNDDADASIPVRSFLVEEESEGAMSHDISLEEILEVDDWTLDLIDDPDRDVIVQSIHQDLFLQSINDILADPNEPMPDPLNNDAALNKQIDKDLFTLLGE